jgi:GT2 family glycosyltransferase
MKKISIVTLTYNQLERATKPYVESLFKYTSKDDFELVFVDNASVDGTVEYLKDLEGKYDNIRVIYNAENKGYSKGNNQGLLEISKDTPFVGLFNNDILFTPGWLEETLRVMDADKKIGLASPRINRNTKVGMTPENYLQKYKSYLKRYKGEFSYGIKVFFCCAIVRREVFEKIGLLDENFTPAFYEDDDYLFRSLYAGFRNGYVNTSFVYHNHQTSTGGLPEKEAILKRNKEYFFDKHYLGKYFYESVEIQRKPLRMIKHCLKNLFAKK